MQILCNTLVEFEKQIKNINDDKTVKSLIILVADGFKGDLKQMENLVRNAEFPLFGGFFPEVIYKGSRVNDGVVLLPQKFEIQTNIFLLGEDEHENDFIANLEKSYQGVSGDLLFVFIDSLGKKKNEFIECLFNFFGIEVKYLGGGTGSLSFQPAPCIIHNTGFFENAAVTALTQKDVCINSAHGWTAVSGSLKVTDSWENQVKNIEWEPALQEYQKIIKEHSNIVLDQDDFFNTAKSYPLGLVKIDGELIIRDPYMTDGESLFLVDKVNQGEYVCIMNGNKDSLLKAANNVVNATCDNRLQQKNPEPLFVIDCISRVLFMGDQFDEELKIIQKKDPHFTGALTIGEIANTGNTFLEIFNKSIVVAQW